MRQSKFAGNWDKQIKPSQKQKRPLQKFALFWEPVFQNTTSVVSPGGSWLRTGSCFQERRRNGRMFWVLVRAQFLPKLSSPPSSFPVPRSCKAWRTGTVPARPATSFTCQRKRSGTEREEPHPQPTGVTGRTPLTFTGLGFQPNQCSPVEKLRAKHTHGIHNIRL